MKSAAALQSLTALGHAPRLAAFRQLVQAGPDGMTVGDLREKLRLPPATLSAHLNMLRAAKLVVDQREGRAIRVRASYAQMNALIAYLTENCCAGKTTCTPITACKPRTRSPRHRGAPRAAAKSRQA
ncbi:MAG: metalloregulator ArsR/SmtB family transcription factor [Lysobacterales bacterium]